MEDKTFDFLAWLTGIVVVMFVGGCLYALGVGKADFKDFTAAVGTLAGLLVGLWKRKDAA